MDIWACDGSRLSIRIHLKPRQCCQISEFIWLKSLQTDVHFFPLKSCPDCPLSPILLSESVVLAALRGNSSRVDSCVQRVEVSSMFSWPNSDQTSTGNRLKWFTRSGLCVNEFEFLLLLISPLSHGGYECHKDNYPVYSNFLQINQKSFPVCGV